MREGYEVRRVFFESDTDGNNDSHDWIFSDGVLLSKYNLTFQAMLLMHDNDETITPQSIPTTKHKLINLKILC